MYSSCHQGQIKMTLSSLVASSSTILPTGRRDAMAATLAQIESLPGASGVALADLAGAMDFLSQPCEGDVPPVAARRKTCAELVGVVGILNASEGHWATKDVTPWFQAQVDAWSTSADPRQKAMAATAARELAELTA